MDREREAYDITLHGREEGIYVSVPVQEPNIDDLVRAMAHAMKCMTFSDDQIKEALHDCATNWGDDQ